MRMRPLIIDARALAEVARVKAYAEAHHYRPGDQTPGDNPKFVAKLSTYRVVFTITHSDAMVWRHLSVSVPSTKWPNPAAVFMLAHHFGFTGWNESKPSDPGKEWLCDMNKREHCIVVAQPLKVEPGTKTH
jgi:hypothetical protein